MYWFLFLTLLTSCSRQLLEVRSQYLNPDYLASTHVRTPDPCRSCYLGQQIVIRYKVPQRCLEGAQVQLAVRYGDFSSAQFVKPIAKSRGYFLFRLVNVDYWTRQGIISYKVDLTSQGCLLATKQHHLWADLISAK